MPELDVQPNGELRATTAVCGSPLGARPIHHQARTGDDPALVSFDDSAVHTLARAEVVGVDDERCQSVPSIGGQSMLR